MALTKIKLNELTPKADPVLADCVLLSDSADGGRGKISTLTDLQTLIGGGGGGGAVDSVAGKTGDVTLDASDIAETAALKIMTADERTKLTGIAEGAEVNTVDSVAGKTGDVTLDADDVATTASKLWMSDTQASKLSGIAENANNYTHPETHPQSMIVGLADALAGKAPLADPEFTGVMQSGPQLTKLAGINQWILRNPSGAAFSGGGSNSTGIVKIMLPNIGAGIAFIVSVEIEVFDYTSGGSYSVVVDGFFHTTGNWKYGDARAVFGSIPNAKPNILVGFGVDNGRAVIALENTTTTRSTIRVRVPRVMISWVTDPTPFLGDWSVSVLTASDSTVFAFTRTCYRPLNAESPALTGTPTAPTAAVGTNTTQLATTAFVQAAVAGALSLKGAPGGPTVELLTEGTPSGPTATGMNTTQLATDALTGDLLLTEGTPSGPTATGTKGMARFDADYFYVCTATNTWVRFPKDGSWT